MMYTKIYNLHKIIFIISTYFQRNFISNDWDNNDRDDNDWDDNDWEDNDRDNNEDWHYLKHIIIKKCWRRIA